MLFFERWTSISENNEDQTSISQPLKHTKGPRLLSLKKVVLTLELHFGFIEALSFSHHVMYSLFISLKESQLSHLYSDMKAHLQRQYECLTSWYKHTAAFRLPEVHCSDSFISVLILQMVSLPFHLTAGITPSHTMSSLFTEWKNLVIYLG